MTRVKICGIQRLEDALAAAEAGADYIGLVFVPQRRRRLEVGQAAAIVDGVKAFNGNTPQVVGLFADQPLEEVNDTVEACGLDLAQLCGKETVGYCRQVRAGVIKVVHVPNPPIPPLVKGGDAKLLSQGGNETLPPFEKGGPGGISPLESLTHLIQQYWEAQCLVTLDRLVEGLQGGTGESFDWAIASQLSATGHEFILAGGLTPENVGRAIAQVRPWGVDVSSGVEIDGVKDPDKIRRFLKEARRVRAGR